MVFFNSKKPGIHLVKVDSVTMKSLPNVRFEFKLVGGNALRPAGSRPSWS